MAKFVFLEGHFALLSSIPGARDTGHRSHPILWRDRNYRASLVTCVEAVVSCQYPDVSRILRKYGLQTVTQYNIYRKSITASDQINLIGLAQCLHDTSTIVGATAARSLTHICNLWGSPVVLEACKTVGYRTWVSRLTSAINSGFSHTSTDHARIYVAESLRLCNHMLVVTTGTNELEIEVRGALEKEGLSRILTLLQEEQDLDIQEQLRDYRIAKASQFTRGTTIRGNFGEEV